MMKRIGRVEMSCKHCSPIEGDGPFAYEKYTPNGHEQAVIEPNDDKFILVVKNTSGSGGGSDTAEIKISFCPWCGSILKASPASTECEFEDFGAGSFCHTHNQTFGACKNDGHYKG